VLGMKAVNCQSDHVLAQEHVTASSKEKVLDAVRKNSYPQIYPQRTVPTVPFSDLDAQYSFGIPRQLVKIVPCFGDTSMTVVTMI
jgi:hypothetical protein